MHTKPKTTKFHFLSMEWGRMPVTYTIDNEHTAQLINTCWTKSGGRYMPQSLWLEEGSKSWDPVVMTGQLFQIKRMDTEGNGEKNYWVIFLVLGFFFRRMSWYSTCISVLVNQQVWNRTVWENGRIWATDLKYLDSKKVSSPILVPVRHLWPVQHTCRFSTKYPDQN